MCVSSTRQQTITRSMIKNGKKGIAEQKGQDMWAIRKPMHKETVFWSSYKGGKTKCVNTIIWVDVIILFVYQRVIEY